MKPNYALNINRMNVTSWDDLQLACECAQTVIQALAIANSTCQLTLTRKELGYDYVTLIQADIATCRWDITTMNVMFEDGKFKEVASK